MKPEVVQAIASERSYQDTTHSGCSHSVGEYILIMEQCLVKAKKRWNKEGDIGGLDEVRQVAAVGVACMEECGVVRRGHFKLDLEDPETSS
ncbi:MAG: hypothetical protein KAT93_07880 [Desulfuromonadales bacterium]|nr:hypothetical protein [Desulfuromonadales bacterium]